MIELEDERGIMFWPEFEVASLTPDFGGRWRAVLGDGGVAHRATAPMGGPWLELGTSRVLPRWLKRCAKGWHDPANFVYAFQELAEVIGPAPGPVIEGLACAAEQVMSLSGDGDGCIWHSQVGDIRWNMSAPRAAALHADMVKVVRGLYVNRRRLRRVVPDGKHFLLIMDDGSCLTRLPRSGHRRVAARFGLPHFDYLEPRLEALARELLRDYPYEIVTAPAELLRADFGSARQLIANLVWQTVRYRQLGIHKEYGSNYRGYWYGAVVATLYRAGFVTRAEVEREVEDRSSDSSLYQLFQEVVARLVGDDRLFVFQEMGFQDPAAHLRQLGDRRPEVVVVAEKESLLGNLRLMNKEFGVTTLVTGGMPKLLASEFFVRALRTVVSGPVRVIAYVDYDPAGWVIGASFASQLARYGLLLQGEVEYLVRAQSFTPAELALYALPCPMGSPEKRKLAERWVATSGGIDGKPLGIHVNHLQPAERVVQALKGLLA